MLVCVVVAEKMEVKVVIPYVKVPDITITKGECPLRPL